VNLALALDGEVHPEVRVGDAVEAID